ncbi:MAG: glycine cleavage system protein H [Anaerolineales bacterium]|jgi:glycine cleavage system H protein|nr:glycine cleavage system protein H [Anaerolineales bacterium]
MLYYGCDIPEDLYYHQEYDSWVRFEADGTATLGMTDVAQTMSGKLLHIQFKSPGKTVKAGRVAATIESGKWVGPFVMPFDAELLAINDKAFADDILIANRDPYGAGWLVKVRPLQPENARDGLLTGQEAMTHIQKKVDANGIRCYRCVE